MYKFFLKKPFLLDKFHSYLKAAEETGQFTNYGYAVKLLEERARSMLKIDASKAIIATSSGATAISAIIYAIIRASDSVTRVGTQDFNFPAAAQGAAQGAFLVDLDNKLNININDQLLRDHIDTIIVTNCFGHLQDLDSILALENKNIVFDNAATPYSFWKGTNSCNLGVGAAISLHHTKPIGFGEGGLVIIDRKYEEDVRNIIAFGWQNGSFNERGGNYKMSELSAAGILQWWDQFDIDVLADTFFNNYCQQRYALREKTGMVFPHRAKESDIFFPNCYPFIHENKTNLENQNDQEARKYYKPLRGFGNSTYVYERIVCYPVAEKINE